MGGQRHSEKGLHEVVPGWVWVAVGCCWECGFYSRGSGKPSEGFTRHDKRV